MPEIVVERDENGLPICKRCRIAIQDESQHEVYEDEVHAPGIFLGPYCQDCLPYIKTCSQCNHGFSLWEEAEKSDEITYVGEGLWLCHECKDNSNFCNICDRRKEDCIPFDGFEKVCHDCRSLRTFSCAECDTLRLENNSVAHYVASDIQASYKHLFSTPLDLVCKDCWTQRTDGEEPADITLCECCDEFFPTRDPNEPRSNKYCDGCYTNRMIIECDWCEESVEHGNAYHIRDEWICHHCYENKFRCVSCNNIHDNRNMYTGTHKFNRQETGSKLCKGCGDSGKNMICPTCKSYTNNTEVFEGKRVCNICKHQLNMCPVCKEAHLGEVQ